jgi:hypothetical protein
MPDSNRRMFLRSFLGAGGLLLPLAGSNALALPVTDAAARTPVTARALPFTAECLQLRDLKREMHDRPFDGRIDGPWSRMSDQYAAIADAIAARPNPTWSDCVELAEIAWHISPKEEIVMPSGR